jgi:Ser/Thr protein kinase RdoA (MazF antagonist)
MHETLPLHQYGLGDALVSPLSGGAINNVYRVESGRGVFVLKEYSGVEMTPERLTRVCDAMALARDAGLPVPRVVHMGDGSAFAIRDSRFFVLTEFVQGRTHPAGMMPERAARNLGAIHARLLDSLRGLGDAPAQELPNLDWVRAYLDQLLEIGSRRRHDDPVDEAACLELEQKLRMLEAWSGPVPVVHPQWTHGDYTWRNILFDDADELVAIIDFDNLRFTSRGRDVMRCFTLSFPHGSNTALSYFQGYAQVAKPAAEDVREYVNLYRYMSMYGTWPADVRYLETASYQRRWDEFIGPRPLAWETGWEELAEQLASLCEF